VHRDIKPQNILIDENYLIKYCDFNVSEVLENNNPYLQKTEGTYHFMPPECLDDDSEQFNAYLVDI